MARWSNNFIGIINVLTFAVSIVILGGGVWLAAKGNSVCAELLKWPVIFTGLFFMVLSIAGFLGACLKFTWLLVGYQFFMFLFIIALFCFTVIAYAMTIKGAGEVVSNQGFKEYQLGDYSNWLQRAVDNSANWQRIKICIQDAKICKNLADDSINETAPEFYDKNLSAIESGCCEPPTSCGFTFVNATVWIVNSSSFANNTNPDCGLWSNDQDQLCYGCSACKAGVLATLKHDWKKVAVLVIILLAALLIVFFVACFACLNIRKKGQKEK